MNLDFTLTTEDYNEEQVLENSTANEVAPYIARCDKAIAELSKGIVDIDLFVNFPQGNEGLIRVASSNKPMPDNKAYEKHNSYVRKAFDVLFDSEYLLQIYTELDTSEYDQELQRIKDNFILNLNSLILFNNSSFENGIIPIKDAMAEKSRTETKEGGKIRIDLPRSMYIEALASIEQDNLMLDTTIKWILTLEIAAYRRFNQIISSKGIDSVDFLEFINPNLNQKYAWPANIDSLFKVFVTFNAENRNYAQWFCGINHAQKYFPLNSALHSINKLMLRQFFVHFTAKCGFMDALNKGALDLFLHIFEDIKNPSILKRIKASIKNTTTNNINLEQ